MNITKQSLVKSSLNLLGDNPNHTFFSVTVRPYESFLHRFPYYDRIQITEDIILNLILKYEAHLISHPNKPKNQHLKIISHNAIETKTKYGSPDIPHSHGIWGLHDTFLEKWHSTTFYDRIIEGGSFVVDGRWYPLRKVIHSMRQKPFSSNLVEKTTPEGWLNYAYKWAGDTDPVSNWSFVISPQNQNKQIKKEIWHEPYSTNQRFSQRL